MLSVLPFVVSMQAAYAAAASGVAADQSADFDVTILTSRGLDPALARIFAQKLNKQKPRFYGGRQWINLSVNNVQLGNVEARFDGVGNLCFDPELIRRARLIMPAGLALDQPVSTVQNVVDSENSSKPIEIVAAAGCYDYRQTQSQTVVDLDPAQNSVRIAVPASALQASMPTDGYNTGRLGVKLGKSVAANQTSGGSNDIPAAVVQAAADAESGDISASTDQTAPEASQSPHRKDQPVEFDVETLKARGLDPALAEYFARKPRFNPGIHRVSLSVNDAQRGSVDARFDEDGNLCFDPELIRRARLIKPAAAADQPVSTARDAEQSGNAPAPAAVDPTPACYDYRQTVSQTEVELDPGQDAVRLVVPASALQVSMPGDGFSTGGVGAMLNYDILTSSSQNSGGSSQSLYVNLENGVNAGDWIVRSQQTFSSDSAHSDSSGNVRGNNHVQVPYFYAQHTFPAYSSIVQGGRIVSQTSMFAGLPLDGVQILPDDALSPRANSNAYEGIAQSQARVEVRQAGLLIYSTVVPAGPFKLANLPLIDSISEVEIKLIESDGQNRVFKVAPASLGANVSVPATGLSASLGRIRNLNNDFSMQQPLVAAVSKGWRVRQSVTLAAGALASSGYQALAANATAPLSKSLSGSVQTQMTHAGAEGVIGNSTTFNVYGKVAAGLSANFYGTWQSRGYRSIYSTLVKQAPEQSLNGDGSPVVNVQRLPVNVSDSMIKTQMGASVGLTRNAIGSVSLSYNRLETYGGRSAQRVMASWNRQIGKAYASLSLERSLGGVSGAVTAYASLSMPLGKVNAGSYVSNSGGQVRAGVRASQAVNEYLSYNISADQGQAAGSDQINVSAALMPRYAQASVNVSSAGGGRSKVMSAQLQGGVVATGRGLTLSPYAIGDTFGVASAGDLAGVRIATPQGTVWTDFRGQAVIPSLSAYGISNLQIATKTLPRNVDVRNGFQEVSAGRGSVSFVDFGVVKVRRILLNARFADDRPLPQDSGIFDADNHYVTTAVADGQVFLDNPSATGLYAKTPNGEKCELHFKLPEKQDLNAVFEHADAVCRAVD
ncbi:fimbria/pilus outer membrane usher protein [Collimonas sp.]|uniref:fimbria/pilus outer membrane usher protein n=1 Tax=Collimonas sp. TaxID=1963772 RepID=UPI002C9E363D|nr:fimbria/pilus outer membrane usher protein [Collimonas sp.]HWW08368.1 fimbria/pilus outer membrane usher protein [Collimonas sp.]